MYTADTPLETVQLDYAAGKISPTQLSQVLTTIGRPDLIPKDLQPSREPNYLQMALKNQAERAPGATEEIPGAKLNRLLNLTVEVPPAPTSYAEQERRKAAVEPELNARGFTLTQEAAEITINGQQTVSHKFVVRDQQGNAGTSGGIEYVESFLAGLRNQEAANRADQELNDARNRYRQELQREALENDPNARLARLESLVEKLLAKFGGDE